MAKLNSIAFATRHTSLGIMAAGSVGIFVANLLFKEVFTEADYGIYSLVITCLSLFNSFGLLGLEQVILRTANIETKNRLKINRFLIRSTIAIMLAGSVIFGLLLSGGLISILSDLTAILMTFGITFTMLLYNLLRLNSDFVISQWILNLWKIALGVVALIALLYSGWELIRLLDFLAYFLFGSSVLCGVYVLFRFEFETAEEPRSSEIVRFAFQFFIALLGISLISYADKFFVEYRFGLEQLGYYFYLANLFIFPFSLIQNYIGFKALVAFKKSFNISILLARLRQTSLLGLLMTIAITAGVYFAARLELVAVDFAGSAWLMGLMLAVGFIKLNYALFSATIGARADISIIRSINISVLILSALVAIGAYYLIDTLEQVAVTVLILWAIRLLTYGFNIFKKIPNIES